jgi:putative membrane protein
VSGRRSGTTAGLALLLATLADAPPLVAHAGPPPAPGDLWSTWTLDPWTLAVLGIAALAYRRGLGELWRSAGAGRGIRGWEALAYLLGVLSLLVALVSPLDGLGAALFSAHMLQHVLLMLVAAPLMVMGRPGIALLWALPPRPRARVATLVRSSGVRAAWRTVRHPVGAWLIHGAAVWVWHAPLLYMAAVRSPLLHALQHLAFFGTAALFWWTASELARARRRRFGLGVLYVFTTAVHGAALGALLTFSSVLWYPVYRGRSELWGLQPIEDQQIGGLLMWVPSGVLYLGAALLLLGLGLAAGEAPAPSPRSATPAGER